MSKLCVLVKGCLNTSLERQYLRCDFLRYDFFNFFKSALDVRRLLKYLADFGSVKSLHQNSDGISLKLEHLFDFCHNTYAVVIVFYRQLHVLVFLRGKENLLVCNHCGFKRLYRFFPAHVKVKNHIREYVKSSQRNHRKRHNLRLLSLGFFRRFFFHIKKLV